MKYSFNDKGYDIVISYKNIKNMYMRIKNDLCIYISAPVGISNRKIIEFVNNNSRFIEKNLLNIESKVSYNFGKFMYLGKYYDMTSKWGVCNVTDNVITLNLELIKFDIRYLDYVIYHELSHLIHPNHSSSFWKLVSCYVPDYKKIRKDMKSFL